MPPANDSVAVAQAAARDAGREMRVIANERNSGSVFAQWRRAAAAAAGEFIWLCEADDSAAPEFLARLFEAMGGDENILMAVSDSRAVDETGKQVMPSYQSYYFASGVRELAASGIWDAKIFAEKFLAQRNLIPNVSAVLWRRAALLAALDAVPELEGWRLAGDWRLYLALLTGQAGKLLYLARPLNTHRRHDGGVTQRLGAKAHVAEIARMHAEAAQSLGLDAAAKAAQAQYRALIEAQLGGGKQKAPPKIARKAKV